jgi:hypothetical protein
MGTLISRTIRFSAGTSISTIYQGNAKAYDLKVDVGPRVFKGLIYNTGENPVTITLDGYSVDPDTKVGAWTTRATVSSVKAHSQAVLSGYIQGLETLVRIQAVTVGGETQGQIELVDESDSLKR